MNTTAVIILAMGLMGISGCSVYDKNHYQSNSLPVPQITRKHDMYATVRLSGAVREFQLSFSPVSNWAISLAGFKKHAKENISVADGFESSSLVETNYTEAAVGYYKKNKSNTTINLYAGYGRGYMYNYIRDYAPTLANYRKYYVQPFVINDKPHFRFAIGARVTLLHYTGISGYQLNGRYEDAGLQFIAGRKTHLLLEPVIVLGVGVKGIKYHLQAGRSYGAHDLMSSSKLFGGLNVGIHCNPATLFRKANKQKKLYL